MKRKTKMFVDDLMEHPQKTAVQAYVDVHPESSRLSARTQASHLLSQPNVLAYMKKHSEKAEQTIVQVMKNGNKKEHRDSVQWQRLTLDAADKVLDRNYGKPTTTNNNVNVNVSLENALSDLN